MMANTQEDIFVIDKCGSSLDEIQSNITYDFTEFRETSPATTSQSFKSRKPMYGKRYHEFDFDNKFRPGRISRELRRALNLNSHDIPIHIYRMRTLGYPPGWLKKAVVGGSKVSYNKSALIGYPGFNIELDRSVRDEYLYLRCPPMQKHHMLDNFYASLTSEASCSATNAIVSHSQRSNHIQLTEKEINDFIAHSNSEDSESDWDDIGEIDLSTVLSTSTDVMNNNTIRTCTNEVTTASNHKSTSRSIKDIGVTELFGTIPSNLLLNEKENNMDICELFGESNPSNCNDDDSNEGNFNELQGTEDDENDYGLSENGASIHKSLSVREQFEKDKLVEHHVNKAIQLEEAKKNSASSIIFSKSNANNDSNNSVSIALAACALRRQKALSALNASAFTPTPVVSLKSTAITPISNNNNINNNNRPRISSELWCSRTSDREVLTLPQYVQRHRNHQFVSKANKSFTSESVVVGIVGSKLPPRRSRNDRIYSVWCLSDLENIGPGYSSGCVKLLLFGNCHEKLWKEPEGSVVAVLNPRSLASGESFTDNKDVSITLESPLHLMILGESPDYGICSAITKSGQSCFHVINNLPGFGGHSRRSRYNGDRPPDAPEPGIFTLPINTNFMVDKCYKPIVPTAKVKLSVTKLKAAGYHVDTSIGLGRNPETAKTPNASSSSMDNKRNTSLLEKDIPLISGNDSSLIIDKTIKKITKDNFEENTSNHNDQIQSELNEAESKLVSVLRRPSAGSLNLLRHLEQESKHETVSDISKTTKQSVKKLNSTKSARNPLELSSSHLNSASPVTFAGFFSSVNEKRKHSISTLPAISKPILSTNSEEFIDLGPLPLTSSQTVLSHSTSASLISDPARLRATALVNSQGGVSKMIEKESLKRKTNFSKVSSGANASPLSEILDNNPSKRAKLTSSSLLSDLVTDSQSKNASNETIQKQLKENRAKKLAELAKQINQGSSHSNLVDELEKQTEQIRLASLERRDEFEQKLYLKGFKHYFRCRQCSKRTVSLDRYPLKPCQHCGESLFEKTGIMKERKGASLPHEQLLPRGIEEKFLS
ncbi:Protein MCM10 like [Schistosoma japonicum]|nr:Protein MCM10 like [Schistosoma japonicum]